MNGESATQTDIPMEQGSMPHEPQHAAAEAGYEPRHAAPEVDLEELEGQIQAADEYRYQQMFRQYLAEYAAERGPSDPGASRSSKQQFIKQQRKIAADAIEQQRIAKGYADEKRTRIDAIFGDLSVYEEPYIGLHRKSAEVPEEEVAPPEESPEEMPEASPPPAPVETPAESPAAETLTDMPAVKEEAPLTDGEAVPSEAEHVPLTRRFKNAWYAAGAATAAYFMHPEKGRRRQILTVLGGFAVIAGAAYLAGKGQFGFDWFNHKPPSHELGPQPSTQQFYDSLKPQGYHGQTYEWGAAADSVGPPDANQHLEGLIAGARAQGAEVQTWGDPSTGHWGITYVEVPLAGDGTKAYFDTQHKLAILEYLSKLNEYSSDANTR